MPPHIAHLLTYWVGTLVYGSPSKVKGWMGPLETPLYAGIPLEPMVRALVSVGRLCFDQGDLHLTLGPSQAFKAARGPMRLEGRG